MSIPPSKASFSALAAAATRSLGLGEATVAPHRDGGRRPVISEQTIRYEFRHEIPSMADQRRLLRIVGEVDLLESRGFHVALLVPLGQAQRLLAAMRHESRMGPTYVREATAEDLGWSTAELTAAGYLVVVDPLLEVAAARQARPAGGEYVSDGRSLSIALFASDPDVQALAERVGDFRRWVTASEGASVLEEDLERREATFRKMWERNEGGLRARAEARSLRVLDELRKGRGGRPVR